MIVTPQMWSINQRIEFLEFCNLTSPEDFLVKFELEELRIKYKQLNRKEELGLKVIEGGRQSSEIYTSIAPLTLVK